MGGVEGEGRKGRNYNGRGTERKIRTEKTERGKNKEETGGRERKGGRGGEDIYWGRKKNRDRGRKQHKKQRNEKK